MPLDSRAYFHTLYTALETIPTAELDAANAIIDKAYQDDQTIYVIGNGQSAATASAFALDLTKQTTPPPHRRRFRVIALTDNLSALTAWANDVAYEAVFTEQLKGLMRPGDVVLAISASGNSPNIVHACQWAREHGGRVLGLAGFSGGRLQELADACVVVRIDDYGHVETAHIAVCHYWVDFFRERLAD
jgi:D-sedoheptulose 7-phosphate isomerase